MFEPLPAIVTLAPHIEDGAAEVALKVMNSDDFGLEVFIRLKPCEVCLG